MKRDEEDLKKYKKVIDEDFSRFLRLEKAWVRDISHQVMKTENGWTHDDRRKLREKLLKYIKKKIKGHD